MQKFYCACILHYPFRGENFFKNNRLMKTRLKEGEYSEELLWEQRDSFSKLKDYGITSFIRAFHPEKFKTIWEEFNK